MPKTPRFTLTRLFPIFLITIFAVCISLFSVQSAGNPSVVVNKYFNTGVAANDTVELLVIQNNLDMRGMILKDFSASMASDGGGKFQFTTNALWSSVPAGTLIVLRNNNSAADTTVGGSDYNLDVGLTNTTYFTNLALGTFDIAGTEMVMIKSAGSGGAGVTGSIHVLAGGTAGAQFTATAAPKLIATAGSGTNQFVFANNSTQSINDFDGTDATGAATGLTFGSGNNANNTAYINSLRNPPIVPTCPAGITTTQGTAASAGVSATDSNGTVVNATITSAAVSGITLDSVTPAAGSGGTLTATLNVANTTAVGTYNVVIQYSNNDSPTPQTANCTVVVTVNPPNQVINTNCPTPLNTTQGTATSTGVSATDPDGTVISAAITSTPVAGITLDGFVAASGSGGTATATLNVANTTAQGTYNVDIQYSNNDATPQTATCTVVVNVQAPPPPPGSVVISQVYAGGGNAGATLKNDFIEIINHTGAPIDLSGWSVQYNSATSAGTWQVTPLTAFILQPGQYYLIQEAAGAGGTVDLPTADKVGTIAMGATAGKVALMSNTTPVTGACPTGSALVDLVGYGTTATCFEGAGPAPTLTNSTAALRKEEGCTDTDNNNSDFLSGEPNPRNSSSPTNNCAALRGTGSADPFGVQQGENTTLTVVVSPGSDPTSTGITVTADLTSIGGSAAQSFSGSGNTFTYVATVSPSAPLGNKLLPVTIADDQARTFNTTIALTVQQPHVVISQVYGGGGNASATFRNDFVELYNPTSGPFDLTGWSLQYASATGDGWEFTRQPLGGTIGSGEYYLIQLGSGGSDGVLLPAANITSDINISASSGKLALINNFDPLEGNCPIGDINIQDFVGYGSADCSESANATGPSNNQSALFRKNAGATDSDNNFNDFVVTSPPNPRRTAPIVELGPLVFGTDPRNNGTNAPRDASINVTFTEPVDVVGSWFDITCPSGQHNDATFAVTNSGKTHVITPNVNFAAGEQCTVTIFKDQIHDQDLDDGGPDTDTLPADHVWSFTVATGTLPPYESSVHLTMGDPGCGTVHGCAVASISQPGNFLMDKPEFTISYNRDKGGPNWVSWHLSDEWVGTLTRVDTFRPDPGVPADWYRVQAFDFSGSGFDRGHMVPNADRDKETSIPINQATFLMSNMLAQAPDNNQGPWADLENYLRTLLPANEVYIVAGGFGTGGNNGSGIVNTIAGGNVNVPAETWKVALIIPKGTNDVSRVDCSTRSLAVRMPNIQGIRNVDWQTYITTVDAVETLTGYDFFANLPDAVENCVEAGTNGANVPATANQSASTQEDTPVVITLHAVRPDGDPLTFSIVDGPDNGLLGPIGAPSCSAFACDATVTYTPGSNYNGADSFTFKVNDGSVDSNTSTVSITVGAENDNPDAVNDTATVAEDSGANTIDVLDNDTDAELDTLTVTAVTQGTNGSVAITNDGADVSYTPNPNFFGNDSFTYTVSDGNGGSDTATVNVTVTNVNDAPVLASSVATSLLSTTNSNLFNVGLTATATDQEGETVTITVTVFGDEDDQTATLPGVVHSPDAKDIAPGTLRLRGERVEANDGRVYLIVVTATDTSGGVDRDYHTVVVPKANSSAKIAEVNAQAAAALSFAQANNGTPPPGYVLIGDGPIIGPKQ